MGPYAAALHARVEVAGAGLATLRRLVPARTVMVARAGVSACCVVSLASGVSSRGFGSGASRAWRRCFEDRRARRARVAGGVGGGTRERPARRPSLAARVCCATLGSDFRVCRRIRADIRQTEADPRARYCFAQVPSRSSSAPEPPPTTALGGPAVPAVRCQRIQVLSQAFVGCRGADRGSCLGPGPAPAPPSLLFDTTHLMPRCAGAGSS